MSDELKPIPGEGDQHPVGRLSIKTGVKTEQVQHVVERLAHIIDEQVEESVQMGQPLEPERVAWVIGEVLNQVDDPKPRKTDFENPRELLEHDLLEELKSQPAHIFDTAHDEEGHEFLVPMPPVVWKQCLAALQAQVLPAGDRTPESDSD